jgi:hypothetical protein
MWQAWKRVSRKWNAVAESVPMKPAFAFDVCHGLYRAAREVLDGSLRSTDLASREKYLWRPGMRPRLAEYVADFALAGQRALASPHLASRLVLFRVFYLGNAELHAARAHLGIGELTWEQWSDEVRARVGRELLRRRIFPPRDYFRSASEPRRAANSVSANSARDSRTLANSAKSAKVGEPLTVRDPRRSDKVAS